MPPTLKLKAIKFKAGALPGAPSLRVDTPTVTVLVGPNNSGKSLALRELHRWCVGDDAPRVVVENVELDMPTSETELRELLQPFAAEPAPGQTQQPGHLWVKFPTFGPSPPIVHEQLNVDGTVQSALHGGHAFRYMVLRMYAVRLDGRTRFALVDPQESGDLLLRPRNHFHALWRDDPGRELVRQLTREAFGLHFVIDPHDVGRLRPRLSMRAPFSKVEEQALDQASRDFHANALPMSAVSDGVQAFTGLVAAAVSLPHRVILIDEPEAFLHPPLARRLGRNLSQLAVSREGSLILSTHSAELLIGCVESGVPIRIVRLTFDNAQATARSIEPTDLSELMRDPLLRSAQALRALFHRAIVVTEAERDRAFYDEINYRLQIQQRGLADCMFANAQNWQTIPRMAEPLRRLGVPAAGVMDLDVLLQSKAEWQAIWPMLHCSPAELTLLESERTVVEAILQKLPGTPEQRRANVKMNGVASLQGNDRAVVEAYVRRLAVYGLFLVPMGEVESWLPALGIATTNKRGWLTKMFDRMGADPGDTGYVHPAAGDVWDFIELIAAWAGDPNRKGIPT